MCKSQNRCIRQKEGKELHLVLNLWSATLSSIFVPTYKRKHWNIDFQFNLYIASVMDPTNCFKTLNEQVTHWFPPPPHVCCAIEGMYLQISQEFMIPKIKVHIPSLHEFLEPPEISSYCCQKRFLICIKRSQKSSVKFSSKNIFKRTIFFFQSKHFKISNFPTSFTLFFGYVFHLISH